jgi:hypothetical protein
MCVWSKIVAEVATVVVTRIIVLVVSVAIVELAAVV